MVSQGYALARAELLRALVARTGVTTLDGIGLDTLVDSDLIGWDQRKIVEKTILISSGDSNGEDAAAVLFDPGTGTITVSPAFSHQILAGTIYRIINISTVELDVINILARIGASGDPAGINTLFAWLAKIWAGLMAMADILHEQADVAISDIAPIAPLVFTILDLSAANTRYVLRNLRIKAVDPGANIITVRLYELINNVLTEVDNFDITTLNFSTHFSLMDMFGMCQIAGDRIKVTIEASAVGYAFLAQYAHATAII